MNNDPYPLLHDSKLSVQERIQQAFSWIREPENCPIADQGPASAKCYLMYRWIDGLLTKEELAEVMAENTPVQNPALNARWQMSLATAEIYVAGVNEDYEHMSWLCDKIINTWILSAHALWPPQVLNFLRASLLRTYYRHLIHPTLVEMDVHGVISSWRRHVDSWDWQKWPYRPMEALSDMLTLQAILFVARSAGLTEFEDHDWVNPERVISFPGTQYCPMYKILKEMGELNEERRIWR